ncbi:MAG: ATP-binding protein [Eubacteriales bacterium]|jgi:lon-related putative ATP-dependent protease
MAIEIKNFEIPAEKLRKRCSIEEFSYETTTKLPPLQNFIGQERAIKAMAFGVSMAAPGYNIYVAGPPGTGKSTYAQAVLTEYAQNKPVPGDWCIIYNFINPDQPYVVSLPAGKAMFFKQEMEELIYDIRATVPKLFEGVEYEKNKQAILDEMEIQINAEMEKVKQEAKEVGFVMKHGPEGMMFIPVKDGKRLTPEEFEMLPPDKQKEIQLAVRLLQQRMEEVFNNGKMIEKLTQEKINRMNREIAWRAIGPLVGSVQEKYRGFPKIQQYLNEVFDDIIQNHNQFNVTEAPKTGPFDFVDPRELFNRYKVNIFINNSDTKGAPVVIETNPTYYNLFGKIEYKNIMGGMSTDFTMIKPGAIHRANGGYLVLQAKDVFQDPFAWDALKKAIKNRQTVVTNIGEQYRIIPTASLRPEPIPVDVKIVLIGNYYIYHILNAYDEDFQKFFRLKVDFDNEMPRTSENLNYYAAFVGEVCRRENLTHFDRSGLAELIEFGSRLSGSQKKLSTCFNDIVQIVYEADIWARAEGASYICAPHVRRAFEERTYRSSRIEEKMQEMVVQGKFLLSTQGSAVGQVNGLSVINVGDYSFGRPSRITAKTFMGQEGLVNIERETHMSGSLHTKGVLTLTGFLGDRFAQDKPMRLTARITFEQLYEGIDGDSASSTELYALLSAISGLPLRQDIAVTGSVNQNGEIQPIGGATEKIEGFFEVCKAKGLTGDQGVMIPALNIDDLMLKHEVLDAVKEGKFHIYAVRTVEEGISLLTGTEAGERTEDGAYPENTVFDLVDKRLRRYAEDLSSFGKDNDKDKDKQEEDPDCGACGDC